MKNKNFYNQRQGGAAMTLVVIFFLIISMVIISGLIVPMTNDVNSVNQNLNSKKAYFLAESGVEDAIYRILQNKTIGTSETITLGSNSVTTTINTGIGNSKEIVSLGDVSNHERKANIILKTGEGAVFKYGTQAGQGGFVFKPNSYIEGNLYSNGNIVGSNNAYITGSAYVAGSSGSISNMRIGYEAIGDAHAHTVTDSTVTGNLYCKVGSGNNKFCNTSENDPEPMDLPVSEENITKWKNDATLGGVINNNVTISDPTTMGPKKIVGNLTINSTLTIEDTIYVTGNIVISGGVKLDSSYGASSGVIVSDGYILVGNSVVFSDSGTAGSYILLLSESSCDESIAGSPCYGKNAIDVANNSNISIVNAQKGTVYFSNNAGVKEAVGNKIMLKNNVHISYGTGVINVGFTSGPSGSWVVDSWKETE